jgi:ABC-type Co2+ transport system permease subunit
MTPQEGFDNTGTSSPGSTPGVAGSKAASTIVLLAGVWFFFSPWIFGASGHGDAWNAWIVGALLFVLGVIRVSRPLGTTSLSWLNALMGAWVFFSPWIYAYTTNTGRFINSLCVGVTVFVLAVVSARSSRMIGSGMNRPLTH